MVDVGDNGHVTNIFFAIHKGTDLIDSEVHLKYNGSCTAYKDQTANDEKKEHEIGQETGTTTP